MTVNANKVSFTVENTYSNPVAYTVQIKTTTGGAWTTIATNPVVPSNGKVELWYNGTTWTTTLNLANVTTIYGVRLVVTAMDKAAYFNLIELTAALQIDVSNDVISQQSTHTMAQPDFISPLGQISSNTGQLVLFNETRTYSNDNASSILYGIVDKGVKFTCWYNYGGDLVQEFEMYADVWTEGESDVTVALLDNTTIFMNTIPRAVLYRNIPIQEAVWRICDIVGFTDYTVKTISTDPQSIIDIFWTDGTKTVWDIFSELSRATQTAIFFDSYGKLQIVPRGAAWNSAQATSYTFNREDVPGGAPSNIISLSKTTNYEANKVTVSWQPTNFAEKRDNIIPFEMVWQPDGDVVLRSSELVADITSTSVYITLGQADGSTWPFSGYCQIEGEWIAYTGKRYVWYDETNTRQVSVVNDLASQQALDARTGAFYTHLNQYSGHLFITERGAYNTEAKDHHAQLYLNATNGWTKLRRIGYSTNVSPCAGIVLTPSQSQVSLQSDKGTMNDYTYLMRGNATDPGFSRIGTRMRIDKTSHRDKVGGIFFSGTSQGAGYFIEVQASVKMTGPLRATHNEITLYSMKTDGSKQQFGGEIVTLRDYSHNHPGGATYKENIGAQFPVVQGTYIELDVTVTSGTNDTIEVRANGQLLFSTTITAASGWKQSYVSRSGLYVRGISKATFDYFYSSYNAFSPAPLDNESYYNRISGGYYADQWQKDWAYDIRTVRRKIKGKWTKVAQKYNQRFYDEFGPMVHEIRKFDVKFTSATPSLQSKLYFSNDSQVVCTEFWSDPMNAHFTLANISRYNAVVSGDDTLTTQGNGTIAQKLFVYGRPVIQGTKLQIVQEDTTALGKRRGPIAIEYASPWIQNKQEATNFANWLTTHWQKADSDVTLEVFGNPLIELTDLVHVNYLDINANYYVVGIDNAFDGGLTTKLSLRRAS
jgi:hypothetical protein